MSLVIFLLEVSLEDVFVGNSLFWGVIVDVIVIFKSIPSNMAVSFFFGFVPMVSRFPAKVREQAQPGFE